MSSQTTTDPNTNQVTNAVTEGSKSVAMSAVKKPKLVFFHSPRSGRCRRVEGFLAQVLQRRHNHDTLEVVRVSVDDRPDLAARFRVSDVPTLLLIHERKVQERIVGPKGCRELERQLAPWLR